jgi:multidrug efflux pump
LDVTIDRDAAARLGVGIAAIDDALNNAYSQRQISTIYTQRNQYKVVIEIDPKLQTDPSLLDRLYVGSSHGTQVPLAALARSSGPGPGRDPEFQSRPGHGARHGNRGRSERRR